MVWDLPIGVAIPRGHLGAAPTGGHDPRMFVVHHVVEHVCGGVVVLVDALVYKHVSSAVVGSVVVRCGSRILQVQRGLVVDSRTRAARVQRVALRSGSAARAVDRERCPIPSEPIHLEKCVYIAGVEARVCGKGNRGFFRRTVRIVV